MHPEAKIGARARPRSGRGRRPPPSAAVIEAGTAVPLGSDSYGIIRTALLVIASQAHSMPLLLIAVAMAGLSEGLGYRGGLEVVNNMAPDEVLSAYLIFCYAGLSIPPVGVGVLSELAGPATAEVTFAVTVAAIALAGLAIGIKYARRAAPRPDTGP